MALLLPAEYLAAVRSGHTGLGAISALPFDSKPFPTTPAQDAVWQGYLNASADQLEMATTEALAWYNTMRHQLDVLDLPLMQQPALAYGRPTTWTKDLDQKLLDLATMGDHVVSWLRDAARGNRQLAVQGDAWGLVAKPDDPFHITVDATKSPPEIIMMAGPPLDHELHMSPTGLSGALVVGGVAIPWIIVGVGIVGIFAIQGFLIYVLYSTIVAIREVMQGIIQYWNQKTWADCVQTAKDPEACHRTVDSLATYQEKLNEGRPPSVGEDVAKGAKGLSDLGKTVLWIMAGGGLLYLGAELLPPFLAKRKAVEEAEAAAKALAVGAEIAEAAA
jgi:hypothetical protein